MGRYKQLKFEDLSDTNKTEVEKTSKSVPNRTSG